MTLELEVLLDRSRIKKTELRRLEQQRVVLLLKPGSDGRDHLIGELTASRAALLHDIAKQTPGYAVASHWAVEKYGFDVAVGTVRYNKRRDGCYTFGMPGRPVMAVWVDASRR